MSDAALCCPVPEARKRCWPRLRVIAPTKTGHELILVQVETVYISMGPSVCCTNISCSASPASNTPTTPTPDPTNRPNRPLILRRFDTAGPPGLLWLSSRSPPPTNELQRPPLQSQLLTKKRPEHHLWSGNRNQNNHVEEAGYQKEQKKRCACGTSAGPPETPTRQQMAGAERLKQQPMEIPISLLESPMCSLFHGSYPVSVRPTRRDKQEPGLLKTHPHRAAWLRAKGITSLRVVSSNSNEFNKLFSKRNVDEDADFLAFIEVLLDDKKRRERANLASSKASQSTFMF